VQIPAETPFFMRVTGGEAEPNLLARMFHIRPALVVVGLEVETGLETETCLGTGDVARDRHDAEWDILRCGDGFRAMSGTQRSPLFRSADEARRWVTGGEAHVGLSDTVIFGVAIGVIGLALVYGLVSKVIG